MNHDHQGIPSSNHDFAGRRRGTPIAVAQRMPELHRQLLERRREILARVARTERQLRLFAESVEPPDDEAQEQDLTELLVRLDEREHETVAAIDAALGRMAEGGYGRCNTCGQAIALARLSALPEAVECVRCAARPVTKIRETAS